MSFATPEVRFASTCGGDTTVLTPVLPQETCLTFTDDKGESQPSIQTFFESFADGFTLADSDGATYSAEFSFDIYLYVDSTFNDYVTAIADGTIENPTTLQETYAEDYSSYVMSWDCKMQTMVSGASTDVGEKTNSGCCLRDMEEDTEGGGYCLIFTNGGVQTYDTYKLTEDDFASVVNQSQFALDSQKVESDDTSAGFTSFWCADTADQYGLYGCRKYQFWPAASYASGFRFDAGFDVRAYMYDNNADSLN